jgi:hypothetical protein
LEGTAKLPKMTMGYVTYNIFRNSLMLEKLGNIKPILPLFPLWELTLMDKTRVLRLKKIQNLEFRQIQFIFSTKKSTASKIDLKLVIMFCLKDSSCARSLRTKDKFLNFQGTWPAINSKKRAR